jgi:hypothetical protein
LVIKALDPYWIRIRIWIQIRIGLQHQALDPDPEKINADPQPWLILEMIKGIEIPVKRQNTTDKKNETNNDMVIIL